MFCPECGQESSGKFCPRCGASLETGRVQPQAESAQVQQTPANEAATEPIAAGAGAATEAGSVQQAQQTPANAATTEPIVAGGETAAAGAEAGVAAGEAQQTQEAPQSPYGQAQQTQETPQSPYGQAQQTQEAPQSPYGQAQQAQEAPQSPYGQAQQPYGGAPQGVPPQPAKEPWYGKTWVIVLFLLFFWPVGIVLMWMKSCKWAKGAKIGVTIALAVLVIGAIATSAVMTSQLLNAAQSTATRSSSVSKSSSASKSTSASSSSSKSSSSSASTKSGSSQGNSAITADCIDSSGNPSLYAISQLDGKSIKQMLEEYIGYTWDSSEGGWVYSKDSTVFAVMNQSSTLGKSDVEKLAAAGGDTPLVYVATLAGVKTLDQALNEGHVVVEDKVIQSDGSGVAVFYGPNMQEMMVVGSPDTNNTNYGNFSLLVFNRKAFESGLASEKLGIGSQGMSMEQFWQTMTGKTLNN